MKTDIDRLLADCPGAESEYYENSGWLENEDLERLDAIYAKYSAIFERRLAELTELLGTPEMTDKSNGSLIARWYPEALRAACWIIDGKTLCLALEHADKECPVGVLLRCLSASEIEEMSV